MTEKSRKDTTAYLVAVLAAWLGLLVVLNVEAKTESDKSYDRQKAYIACIERFDPAVCHDVRP